MAALTFQQITEASELTPITLSASDTFTMPTSGRSYIMVIGSAAKTVTMTGEGVPVTQVLPGYGSAVFNAVDVAVEDTKNYLKPLNPQAELLKGTVTVTGGDGLTVYLYTI